MPEQIIEIYLNDGVIQVEGIEENQKVIIKDFDCPDDWEGAKKDDQGNVYEEIVLTKKHCDENYYGN